ncbi:hypothetical protein BpHYR1_013836 [Brachionus plicatilis]|uniref:Uncharacterized protein n=1 Tax=Brachionus plicatilis TaxID=10195 RepID=A0A3M7QC59_BRAPC|nr:hypothetical protein BpHYR1_013836 [Brachionus plicatilis]
MTGKYLIPFDVISPTSINLIKYEKITLTDNENVNMFFWSVWHLKIQFQAKNRLLFPFKNGIRSTIVDMKLKRCTFPLEKSG